MKVAIVGGASSNMHAPFDDPEWDIWVLGNQMQRYEGKKVDRIFEIHENLQEHDPKYPQWLCAFGVPLVVSETFYSDNFQYFANEVDVFDYEAASEYIGENFSSSPAVMMAQAIMDGATEIGIWGVDMALDEHEYFMQRPAMEQWIGYAKGKGIKVYIHESSPLGYTAYREGRDWPDKGFSGFDEGYYKDMAKEHKTACIRIEKEINRFLAAQSKLDTLKAQYQGHDGARQVYERLAKAERAKNCGVDVNERAING